KAAQIPGLMFINYVLVADANRFARLSQDARAAIEHAARTQVTDRWSEMRRDDEQVLRDLSAQGAEIWTAQKEDQALWRARIAPRAAFQLRRHQPPLEPAGELAGEPGCGARRPGHRDVAPAAAMADRDGGLSQGGRDSGSLHRHADRERRVVSREPFRRSGGD